MGKYITGEVARQWEMQHWDRALQMLCAQVSGANAFSLLIECWGFLNFVFYFCFILISFTLINPTGFNSIHQNIFGPSYSASFYPTV